MYIYKHAVYASNDKFICKNTDAYKYFEHKPIKLIRNLVLVTALRVVL